MLIVPAHPGEQRIQLAAAQQLAQLQQLLMTVGQQRFLGCRSVSGRLMQRDLQGQLLARWQQQPHRVHGRCGVVCTPGRAQPFRDRHAACRGAIRGFVLKAQHALAESPVVAFEQQQAAGELIGGPAQPADAASWPEIQLHQACGRAGGGDHLQAQRTPAMEGGLAAIGQPPAAGSNEGWRLAHQ